MVNRLIKINRFQNLANDITGQNYLANDIIGHFLYLVNCTL